MKKTTLFFVALTIVATASIELTSRLVAAPDDERTFDITVEGDDGLPQAGHASAKLVKVEGDTASYTLTRTVPGPSAGFATGKATVDTKTHVVHVELDATRTPGMVTALGSGAHAASSTEQATAAFTPSRPSEYEFQAVWKSSAGTFHETWKELTRLTSNVVIHEPSESGSFGPEVTFDATVTKADHVVYFVDRWPIERFSSDGRHTFTKRIWQSGWRHFVVRAYGPSPAKGEEGPLLGEAETVFLAKGLSLTPEHGAHLTKERVRVEAIPLGLDVKTMELRLDGAEVIQVHSEPWGADVSLGKNGEHKLEAVAYGKDGKELARTHSVVTLEVASSTAGSTTGSELPAPPTHTTKLPELKGQPTITHEPANPRNYRAASHRTIDLIVIHKAEGSLNATVSWFRDPVSHVSAHYTVDDTTIAQSVDDENICWHTGNRAYNNRSVGIENSGYTVKDDMTDAHYQRLAKLVAWLAKKHGIPLDRHHVIGHNEVPNPSWPSHGPRWGGSGGHTDPGPYFDWNKLMTYAKAAQN